MRASFFSCVCCCVAACSTSTPTPTPATTASASSGEAALPLLGELVRAWNAGGADAVRGVVKDALGAGAVVEAGVVSGGDGPLWLVVRLSDVPVCSDKEGGVVVGEPPRLLGCGSQDLFAVAAFVNAVVEGVKGAAVVVVDDDDALDRYVVGHRGVAAVWTGGGVIVEGVDKDVFDVEVVDVGRFSVALSAADPTVLVRAVGRAVSLAPPPRFPVVVAEREALVHPGFFADDAAAYVDSGRGAFVVDRCVFGSLVGARAVVDCTALPGRAVADVVDDVVRAVDDRAVTTQTLTQQEASSTSLSLPLAQALATRVTQELPRVVVVPALDVAVRPSVCARMRAAHVPCVAALPLRVHPVARDRRGHVDEAVDAAAVVRGAAFVADVAARVSATGLIVGAKP